MGTILIFIYPYLLCDPTDTCCDPIELDCAGFCFGDAVRDCAGVCNGDAEEDTYGACCLPAEQDCHGRCFGNWTTDLCHVCLAPDDHYRDTECVGCDGVPEPREHKRKRVDACDVCGGDSTSCLDCRNGVISARWYEEGVSWEAPVFETLMIPVPLDGETAAEWYDYDGNGDRSFGRGVPNPTQANMIRIAFVREASNTLSLVVTLDATKGHTGGSATLRLDSNLAGRDMDLLVHDDPEGDDQYQFNATTVSGTFELQWGPYETDGFVLGTYPHLTDLCVNVTATHVYAVQGISLATWDLNTQRLEDAIPFDKLVPNGATVELCTRCSADVDCKWIGGGDHVRDACGDCSRKHSKHFNRRCKDCAGIVNGKNREDACGVCLPHYSPERDVSCTDCAGTVNGPAKLDACGVCNGDGSCFQDDAVITLVVCALVGIVVLLGVCGGMYYYVLVVRPRRRRRCRDKYDHGSTPATHFPPVAPMREPRCANYSTTLDNNVFRRPHMQ